MKLLTKLMVQNILFEIKEAYNEASGSATTMRVAAKQGFRETINHCLNDEERQSFHARSGITLNRLTDMVGIPCLINAIRAGVEDYREHKHKTHGDLLNSLAKGTGALVDAIADIHTAWCNDSKCRPAARGGGVSRGYHVNAYDLSDNMSYLMDAADELLNTPADDEEEDLVEEIGAEIRELAGEYVDIPIDPSLLPAVDALLQQASGSRITGLGHYEEQIKQLRLDQLNLQDDLKAASSKAQAGPAQSGQVVVDATTLDYSIVRVKASTLFTDANGSRSKKLNFLVNTLVWRDEDGNVVRHPNCPDVDASYKFRMHHLIKYLTAKEFGQHSWFHGHTGTGKTSFIEQVEARLGFPIEVLNLDSSLERSDMVGNIDIKVKDGAPYSFFTEGLLPKAMTQPLTFILDEVDAGRPDMLFVLQRALENKGLTITEDAGRVVKPHPLFSFAATANSRGQGDEYGWYQGVRPMNLAFLNRFGAFIEIHYLDEDDEKKFLNDAYPKLDKRMADQFCAFAQLVRGAFMNGEISQTLSPRNLHAMAQYYQHYTDFMSHEDAVKEVVETCVTDAAPADNAQRICELSSRVFDGGL